MHEGYEFTDFEYWHTHWLLDEIYIRCSLGDSALERIAAFCTEFDSISEVTLEESSRSVRYTGAGIMGQVWVFSSEEVVALMKDFSLKVS